MMCSLPGSIRALENAHALSTRPHASTPSTREEAAPAPSSSSCSSGSTTSRYIDGLSSTSSSSCASVDGDICAVDYEASGLWSLLPEEVVEAILSNCSPVKLAMLQSTCNYFRSSSIIDKIARHSLKAVPRARSLQPSRREKETYLALLQFINHQSAAAAQTTAIACGGHHTVALLVPQHSADDTSQSRHALYAFGRNLQGQLGCSDFDDKSSPSIVPLGFQPCTDASEQEEEIIPAVVSCGSTHSMSMSRRGELYSWGLGRHGELGQGPWVHLGAPEPRQTLLLHPMRVVSVACGAAHTMAISESGALWCCGSNSRGQLGNGTLTSSFHLQMVQNLPATRIVSAAAGAAHSVALTSDGSLFTWGDGSQGQLGHEQLQVMAALHCQNTIILPLPQKIAALDPATLAPDNRVTAISAGACHSMVLLVGGGILAFGANQSGCLGLGDCVNRWGPVRVNLALGGEEGLCMRAVQLSCGMSHSLALISRQGSLEVRSTGANTWGQLGTGDCQARNRFVPVLSVPHVCAVHAGAEHSAAVAEDGGVFLWGRGDSGQLGLGDELSRQAPTRLPGFLAVHPDKTLRRSKRYVPLVRPVACAGKEGCGTQWAPVQ